MDVHQLTMSGSSMSAEEARRLESSLELNPNDVDARIKLMGFHFGQHFHKRRSREHACRHIFWLMRNDPAHSVLSLPEAHPHYDTEADDLYNEGAELWDEQTIKHSNNAAVLANAAYFYYHLNWDKAISLMEAALKLEPENRDIKDRLAFTCELGARKDKSGGYLQRAMALREELLKSKAPGKNLRELVNLAENAYRLDDFDRCRATAEQVVQVSVPYDHHGDEFHLAYQLIGLVQQKNADLSRACLSLLRSAKVKSTPSLSSFGPKFQLANELLKLGERATVLQYLKDCSVFWESGQKDLTYWWMQIQLGGTPELNKQGVVELFVPDWLNHPASWFMTVVRASAKSSSSREQS